MEVKCDVCGTGFSVVTMNQFNTIMFGVETGNAIGIKASMCTCNECCNKIIKFIDSISTDTGIVLS